MAKIIFERSGGFFEPLVDFTLDLDTLPPQEAQRMLYLIEDADFFHLPKNLVTAASVDEFLYTITVETSTVQHRVHVRETSVPESLQLLINELWTLPLAN